jgi:hypothetical protein
MMLPASVGSFFLGYSEAAYRAAAVLAGILTCLGVYSLCRMETGSPWVAFTLALLTLSSPYLYHYAQTARGYAANTAMVLALMLIVRGASERNRAQTYAMVTGLSLLMCMNIITTAIMWLAPLFAVLILCGRYPRADRETLRGERLYWLGAAACAAVPCMVYGLCHLGDLIAAQGKWGTQWRSLSELGSMTRSLWTYYIPALWIPAVLLGLIGIGIALARGNWLARVIVLSVIITGLYVIGGHKMPYFRTFGQFLTYIPLGIAWLWAELRDPPAGQRHFPAPAGLGALILLVAIPAAGSLYADVRQPMAPEYTDLAAAIDRAVTQEHQGPDRALVLLPFDQGEQMRYYLPANQDYLNADAPKADPFSVYMPCANNADGNGLLTEMMTSKSRSAGYWLPHPAWAMGKSIPFNGYNLISYPMRRVPGFAASASVPCIVSWCGTDPYFGLRSYIAAQAPRLCGDAVLNLNLDDYLKEPMLTFFIENSSQATAVARILDDLKARTRGKIWTILPSNPSGHP